MDTFKKREALSRKCLFLVEIPVTEDLKCLAILRTDPKADGPGAPVIQVNGGILRFKLFFQDFSCFLIRTDLVQHRFNMLTGTQPVGFEIVAGTEITRIVGTPDSHQVAALPFRISHDIFHKNLPASDLLYNQRVL